MAVIAVFLLRTVLALLVLDVLAVLRALQLCEGEEVGREGGGEAGG